MSTSLPVLVPDRDSLPDPSALACIMEWYSGKALQGIREFAVPALIAGDADGFWPQAGYLGVRSPARRVRALLAKQAPAQKFARANERRRDCSSSQHRDGDIGLLGDVADARGSRYYQAEVSSWDIIHAMEFGLFLRSPKILELTDKLEPFCVNDDERSALATAARWARAFAPVSRLVQRLDASRPRPSFAFGKISPTVFRNVGQTMGLSFESVRAPDVRWEPVVGDDGSISGWIGVIAWPEGTRHGLSKFGVSASGLDQCQACGHAIRDWSNWAPLVLDGASGPASLWVGRDCARRLFGCRFLGEARFRGPLAGVESLASVAT